MIKLTIVKANGSLSFWSLCSIILLDCERQWLLFIIIMHRTSKGLERNTNKKVPPHRFYLSALNLEIKNLLNSYSRNLATHTVPFRSRPEKLNLLKIWILNELKEILMILEQIDDLNKKYRSAKRIRASLQSYQTFDRLKFYIKALYEWLYHLKELIESNQPLKSKLEKEGLWAKLKVYCEIRDKVITHKAGRNGRTGIQVYLSEGMTLPKSADDIELLMLPFAPSASDQQKLDELYTKCWPGLKDHSDYDYFGKWRMLSNWFHELDGELQKEVKVFFSQFGMITHSPSRVAAFIEKLIKALHAEFFPQISTPPPPTARA
jgi:hypothetical protein